MKEAKYNCEVISSLKGLDWTGEYINRRAAQKIQDVNPKDLPLYIHHPWKSKRFEQLLKESES